MCPRPQTNHLVKKHFGIAVAEACAAISLIKVLDAIISNRNVDFRQIAFEPIFRL
jgi:hypothetical protein